MRSPAALRGAEGGAIDLAAWLATRRPPPLPVPAAPGPPTWAARAGRLRGAGVRIALLDGAVDLTHPDLRAARVRGWAPGRGLTEPTAHATACASILVGQGVRDVIGLVPGAEVLAADVLPGGARAGRRGVPGPASPRGAPWGQAAPAPAVPSDEAVVRAVRAALAWGADLLVLPFGRTRPGRRLALALRGASDRGVRVLAAAGNLGPDVLTFPASVTGVVSVTAWDAAGIAPRCSRRGDVAGPGDGVPVAGSTRSATLHGSSPATLLVAGVEALRLGPRRAETGRADASVRTQRDRGTQADEGDEVRRA